MVFIAGLLFPFPGQLPAPPQPFEFLDPRRSNAAFLPKSSPLQDVTVRPTCLTAEALTLRCVCKWSGFIRRPGDAPLPPGISQSM